jgi:hypothetical protein
MGGEDCTIWDGMGGDDEDAAFVFLWFQRWCLGVSIFYWGTEGEFVRLRSLCTFMKVYWRGRECTRRGLLSLMVWLGLL